MDDKVVIQACLETEYKKTGISPKDIAVLRSWVQSQPHLPDVSDLDLILAYNCCDRSLELAKTRIDVHFTSRTHFTTLFKDRVVDENIIKSLKTYVYHFPEKSLYDKHPVLFLSLSDFRVSSIVCNDIARSSLMLLDLIQYEVGCAADTLFLVDCTGATFGHLYKLDIQTFQEYLSYVKDAVFGKMHAIHFLNTPSFATTILRILRPIIPDELLNLVTFHESGSSDIEKIIPIEYLPVESGGRDKTFEQISNECIEKLLANKDFFVRESKMRVTESLRPGKSNKNDSYGSVRGSFKMLDID